MNALFSQPAFQLYVISSAVLTVILYALAAMTGKTRERRRAVVNAEDVKVYNGAAVVEVEHPDVQRIKRAHLNGIENAVPFFVIGLLYALTNPNLILVRGLFVTFVGVRLLHAVFYLTARQPYRAASFAVGMLINLVMVVQVLRAAL